MVRMQLVIERATLSSWYDSFMNTSNHPRIPPSYVLELLHSQLQADKAMWPPDLRNNCTSPPVSVPTDHQACSICTFTL